MSGSCYAALYLLTGANEHKATVVSLMEKDDDYRFELEYALRPISAPRAKGLLEQVEKKEKPTEE